MAESLFKKWAYDLLNIEINTIVKADMSAIKMPSSIRLALYELSTEYHNTLEDLGKLEKYEIRKPSYWEYAGIRSFEELQERARDGVQMFENKLREITETDEEELNKMRKKIKILERIQFQSNQIVDIFKDLEGRLITDKTKDLPGYRIPPELIKKDELEKIKKEERAAPHFESEKWNNDIRTDRMYRIDDLDLTTDQIARIRKAWEIGTEQIVMQTVIQLDGDITTRISENFAKNPNQTILKIHNDSIATSTGFWTSLFKAFAEITGETFKTILGMKK